MKICLLHRYPPADIKQTNAAFPYLAKYGIEARTFRSFNRLSSKRKLLKSLLWIFYAPLLTFGKRYNVIYCDDSFPFYPIFVRLLNPKAKIILRMGDFHLMYYTWGKAYRLLHFFERIGWKLADEIIAISKPMAELISREVDTPVIVINDPVDPADFTIITNSKCRKPVVMFHGLLVKNKNVDWLIEAAYRLPNVQFWVAGDGPDKGRLASISPPNVMFLGWINHSRIYEYIGRCDVGIALRSDNIGNEYVVTSAFLQYSVMGKPCIVTKRKVFKAMGYKWMFNNIADLVDMINILILYPEEGEEIRGFTLLNHHAELIAREIWEEINK